MGLWLACAMTIDGICGAGATFGAHSFEASKFSVLAWADAVSFSLEFDSGRLLPVPDDDPFSALFSCFSKWMVAPNYTLQDFGLTGTMMKKI